MSARRQLLVVVAAALAALALGFLLLRKGASEVQVRSGAAAGAGSPNLLLVTIDTLRADRVGAYGYAGARTEALDRLAREGVLLEDAVVQVPQTRPSHASLFTGRQPYEHGIRDNFSAPLAASHPTLASVLKQRGYVTGGFVGAYPVSRDSGLDRGFDVFDDPFAGAPGGGPRLEQSARPAGLVVDAALAWLEKAGGQPFFAWVHLFDPHAPYEPPPPFAERFAKAPYDGEIAYADQQIGRLLEWLDGSGAASRTLVVATSDHGEGLGEHGEDEHQLFVYDSTLRVPMLFRWPGQLPAGKRIGGQYRSVDLLATLLELLGAPAVPTSGASRAAALRAGGRIPENESYAESLFGQLHFGWAPLRALRGEGFKYVDAPRPELYHLGADAGETRNLAEERAALAAAMRDRLRTYDRVEARAPAVSADPQAAERLAALGYLGGAFFRGTPSGTDPKDRVGEYQAFHAASARAVSLFEKGDFAAVVRELQPLTAPVRGRDGRSERRDSFAVSFYLGRALLELGRFAEAIAPLEVALRLSPRTTTLRAALAHAQAGAGRFEEALATTEAGLAESPRHVALLRMKGRLLLQRGATEQALAALQAGREADPRDVLLRADLANALRGLGRLPEALAEAEAAVEVDPRSAEALVAQGACLAQLGRFDEARAAMARALESAPGHPDAMFFLALADLREGRKAEAAATLEDLLRRAPSYPRAREALAEARAATAPAAPGRLRLRIIRVYDEERAQAVIRRLRASEDFGTVARALSQDPTAPQGGDLGRIRVADLAEPLRTAASRLGPGAIVGPIVTADGLVLLKRER
ncbi:MAG: sulfatase-like hydrolase/transferase [Vicinamibacteria bacterium]